ncbi:MAG: bifunctional precorrin-2 dehydrogenase/sirohydrochlorin ferrochelatase [Deltaproteobacteria bacterium]|nr:bifunctional precorrin-2 dehydrogenase/sirohydrochlorin ferrochelatase [Deltaproteobacteria bacterium]MBW2076177.1 bifunctional precorrin-2 dehydrogenase/sirohydrochlorin ferrochelatase [Deltaproteobacteria bacterium]MBW2310401.1 bifunctional precorrin-2 dehydrogenase/sirohydrochlorin ferrochelatase [Deltaproteobacteria bacterium]RLB32007.1 MAG: bifunctional precorrin-2 dehydrogenase/sirohydrochlorin ferrochelatase [Deltaproteobacteria bacterium]
MSYYPIFVDLKDQGVLVVGGGEVAERKIKNLLTHDCQVYIASPQLTDYLKELVEHNEIQHIDPASLDESLDKVFMVIAATDDSALNSRIASKAKARGILVNSVDQPRDCSFIMPSIVKAGDLQIAISTAGKSPALAKKIRGELERTFGPEYASFIELLGLLRRELIAEGRPSSANKITFQRLVDSPLLELIKAGNIEAVRNTLASILGGLVPIEGIVNQVFSGS